MAGVLTYDSNSVSVVVGGRLITGRGESTFLTIKRNNDSWTLVMGTDGIGSRAKTNDKSGEFEITLHHTSPENSILQAFATADEQTNGGAVPVIVRDNNGATLATAATAWVKKLPDIEYSRDVGERTWTLSSDSIDIAITGNSVT